MRTSRAAPCKLTQVRIRLTLRRIVPCSTFCPAAVHSLADVRHATLAKTAHALVQPQQTRCSTVCLDTDAGILTSTGGVSAVPTSSPTSMEALPQAYIDPASLRVKQSTHIAGKFLDVESLSCGDWVAQQSWPPAHMQVEFVCSSAAVRPLPWPYFILCNCYSMSQSVCWKPPWPLHHQQDVAVGLGATLWLFPKVAWLSNWLYFHLLWKPLWQLPALLELLHADHGYKIVAGADEDHEHEAKEVVLAESTVSDGLAWRQQIWATKIYPEMSEDIASVDTICSPCYAEVVELTAAAAQVQNSVYDESELLKASKSDNGKPEKLEALVAVNGCGNNHIIHTLAGGVLSVGIFRSLILSVDRGIVWSWNYKMMLTRWSSLVLVEADTQWQCGDLCLIALLKGSEIGNIGDDLHSRMWLTDLRPIPWPPPLTLVIQEDRVSLRPTPWPSFHVARHRFGVVTSINFLKLHRWLFDLDPSSSLTVTTVPFVFH